MPIDQIALLKIEIYFSSGKHWLMLWNAGAQARSVVFSQKKMISISEAEINKRIKFLFFMGVLVFWGSMHEGICHVLAVSWVFPGRQCS